MKKVWTYLRISHETTRGRRQRATGLTDALKHDFFLFQPIKSFMLPLPLSLGTLRFATTDGWTRVARYLGDWIEYGALWRVVARKLKLSCYTTNYVLREIAAVEFNLKMSFQKVRDELIYCFARGILDEEEFVLFYLSVLGVRRIFA